MYYRMEPRNEAKPKTTPALTNGNILHYPASDGVERGRKVRGGGGGTNINISPHHARLTDSPSKRVKRRALRRDLNDCPHANIKMGQIKSNISISWNINEKEQDTKRTKSGRMRRSEY
jgi:hypothetical protein